MKLKYLALPLAGLFAAFFCLLLLVALLFASDEDGGRGGIYYGGANLSAEVLAHRPMVERYAAQYGISEYVDVLLAIMQVESGGTLEDVMQSSESMGLPPNSLDTESSIRQGCEYFSELLAKADRLRSGQRDTGVQLRRRVSGLCSVARRQVQLRTGAGVCRGKVRRGACYLQE